MQLLSQSVEMQCKMPTNANNMRKMWNVMQCSIKHSDWYFPSFTPTQKTSAWPSDCIFTCRQFHVWLHFWFDVIRKMSKKLFEKNTSVCTKVE
jgi:hypothetical protein